MILYLGFYLFIYLYQLKWTDLGKLNNKQNAIYLEYCNY